VGFKVTEQLAIRLVGLSDTGKKWEYSKTVHQLFINFKKACDSVRKEPLYNVLTEFGVPLKLVSQIKICLNETCSKFRKGKHLSDSFPIQNDLNKEMLYHHCFSNLL
jgi:hypothetical protein